MTAALCSAQFDDKYTSMLSGLGDRSYANVYGSHVTIGAVKGGRTIIVSFTDFTQPPNPDVQQKAIALARKILEKL